MNEERSLFGFWLYILSDCILFAGLFAAFAVLRGETAGGPSGKDLLDLPFVLLETVVLLVSNYTMGISATAPTRAKVRLWLGITALLGCLFIGLELSEFHSLILAGNGPSRSAFLSAFFTLVGTHGLHVFAGVVWSGYVMALPERGRHRMLALFWHFLDIVWIFIFTIVYLLSSTL